MADTALVVLAAGAGRRFGGLKQLAPVGPGGEAIMDYSVHDAVRAGFERIVVVVGTRSGDEVREHLPAKWPRAIDVELITQPTPTGADKPPGTAHAVVAARDPVGDAAFAVVNADDLYGPGTFRLLRAKLNRPEPPHALVGFRLSDTVLGGSAAVARGICHTDGAGLLTGIVESIVERAADGSFLATPLAGGRGRPVPPDQLVSMNAWAFFPSIWEWLEPAVAAFAAGEGPRRGEEILLPAVVEEMTAGGGGPVEVLASVDRWLGLTWADDLADVRREMLEMVARGAYPHRLWQDA